MVHTSEMRNAPFFLIRLQLPKHLFIIWKEREVIPMTVEEFFKKLDGFFERNEIDKVEPYLVSSLEEAKEAEDYGCYISVANEMIGFYRSISQFKKAFDVSEDVLLLMEEMNLEGTEHFATTLLNVATAYRAAGKQEEAYRYYRQALSIYEQALHPEDARFAGLYNNMGILLENMGKNEEAAESLEKALAVIEKIENAEMERAITLTNLALIYFKINRNEKAMQDLLLAVELFEKKGENTDAHYSAALAGLGEAAFRSGAYKESLSYYEKALSEIKKHFGETMSYSLLCDNCAAVCDRIGDAGKKSYYEKESARIRESLEKQNSAQET